MGSLMLWILQILSGLYIGNFRDSKDLKQLDIHKITHILSIHDDARKLFKARTTFILLQWVFVEWKRRKKMNFF